MLKATHGFYRAFGGANEYPFEKLNELGRIWETPKLTFKSYPCGSISHPYMDCALTLKQKHAIVPQQVAEIVCRTAEGPCTDSGSRSLQAATDEFLRGKIQFALQYRGDAHLRPGGT